MIVATVAGVLQAIDLHSGEILFNYEIGRSLLESVNYQRTGLRRATFPGLVAGDFENETNETRNETLEDAAAQDRPRIVPNIDGSLLYTQDNVKFFFLQEVRIKDLVEQSPISHLPGFPNMYLIGKKSTQMHSLDLVPKSLRAKKSPLVPPRGGAGPGPWSSSHHHSHLFQSPPIDADGPPVPRRLSNLNPRWALSNDALLPKSLEFGEAEYSVEAYDEKTHQLLWSLRYVEIRPVDLNLNSLPTRLQQSFMERFLRDRATTVVDDSELKVFRPYTETEWKDLMSRYNRREEGGGRGGSTGGSGSASSSDPNDIDELMNQPPSSEDRVSHIFRFDQRIMGVYSMMPSYHLLNDLLVSALTVEHAVVVSGQQPAHHLSKGNVDLVRSLFFGEDTTREKMVLPPLPPVRLNQLLDQDDQPLSFFLDEFQNGLENFLTYHPYRGLPNGRGGRVEVDDGISEVGDDYPF